MMRVLAFLVYGGKKSGALLPCVTAPDLPSTALEVFVDMKYFMNEQV
jgi:hypothetical protein